MRNLSELTTVGKEVAFVKGNRTVKNSNVKAKQTSIKEFGIIVPIVCVDGTKAVEDGCTLVNLKGEELGKEVASDYVVIIDGQHRYTAAKEEGIEIPMIEYDGDKSTIALLAEANIATEKWRGTDFISAALANNPDDKLLQFVGELETKKYSMSTISRIVCFSKDLNPKYLTKKINGEAVELGYNLERAKQFLNAAVNKFEDKYIAKRYLIDAVISLTVGSGIEFNKVLDAIGKIEDVEGAVKAKEGVNEIIKSLIQE